MEPLNTDLVNNANFTLLAVVQLQNIDLFAKLVMHLSPPKGNNSITLSFTNAEVRENIWNQMNISTS